jgi:hypothetical protein
MSVPVREHPSLAKLAGLVRQVDADLPIAASLQDVRERQVVGPAGAPERRRVRVHGGAAGATASSAPPIVTTGVVVRMLRR